MKKICQHLMRDHALPAIVLLLVTMFTLVSCGDTGTKGTVTNNWVIDGLIVRDANVSQASGFASLVRNNQALTAALVTIEAPTADSAPSISLGGVGDGTFRQSFSPSALRDTSMLKVRSLVDEFQFSFQTSVPDTFSATVIGLTGGVVRSTTDNVQIRWNPAAFADGYLIVVTPVSSNNHAIGYSKILVGADYISDPPYLSTLIPREKFRDTQGQFQAGDYDVWIAAYHDEPIDNSVLPFTLPTGFARNVNRTGVTGQIGALSISSMILLTAVATP